MIRRQSIGTRMMSRRNESSDISSGESYLVVHEAPVLIDSIIGNRIELVPANSGGFIDCEVDDSYASVSRSEISLYVDADEDEMKALRDFMKRGKSLDLSFGYDQSKVSWYVSEDASGNLFIEFDVDGMHAKLEDVRYPILSTRLGSFVGMLSKNDPDTAECFLGRRVSERRTRRSFRRW